MGIVVAGAGTRGTRHALLVHVEGAIPTTATLALNDVGVDLATERVACAATTASVDVASHY